jgi:hypothetical protein
LSYRSRRGHIHLLRVLPLVGCRSKTSTQGRRGPARSGASASSPIGESKLLQRRRAPPSATPSSSGAAPPPCSRSPHHRAAPLLRRRRTTMRATTLLRCRRTTPRSTALLDPPRCAVGVDPPTPGRAPWGWSSGASAPVPRLPRDGAGADVQQLGAAAGADAAWGSPSPSLVLGSGDQDWEIK